jgi:hypothetical protein
MKKATAVKSPATKAKLELVKADGLASLLKKSGTVSKVGFKAKTRPPTMKPDMFQPGDVLEGILVGVHKIEGTKQKDGSQKSWCKIHIKPEGDELGVEMAAGGMIRFGLEITDEGDVAHTPYIGRAIQIELGNPVRIKSKKGNDAWNFIVRVADAE